MIDAPEIGPAGFPDGAFDIEAEAKAAVAHVESRMDDAKLREWARVEIALRKDEERAARSLSDIATNKRKQAYRMKAVGLNKSLARFYLDNTRTVGAKP